MLQNRRRLPLPLWASLHSGAGFGPLWLEPTSQRPERGPSRSIGAASVIRRYEQVTRLDPDVFFDWVQLDRLYQDAGRMVDARQAAEKAVAAAKGQLDRSTSLLELGYVLTVQGDLTGARKAGQPEDGSSGWRRACCADIRRSAVRSALQRRGRRASCGTHRRRNGRPPHHVATSRLQ